MRSPNTTVRGGSFTPAQIDAVWRKGRHAAGCDPNDVRLDSCNALMRRSEYGMVTTLGWEVDHVQPVAKGGTDDLVNLQPLQWQNNRGKGDRWPEWFCSVTAA